MCRTAWSNLSPSDLWKCTLYTNFEPCAMCAGSIYWANIGCVVYGCTEEKLLELTGDDAENMTLNLNCRQLFNSGQKDVRVFGPFDEVEKDVCSSIDSTEGRCWRTTSSSGRELLIQLRKLRKNSNFEGYSSNVFRYKCVRKLFHSALLCQESTDVMIRINSTNF